MRRFGVRFVYARGRFVGFGRALSYGPDFGLSGRSSVCRSAGTRRAWKACGQSLLALFCGFGIGVWIARASRTLRCRRRYWVRRSLYCNGPVGILCGGWGLPAAYPLGTLSSAFRLLAACCLATKSSAKSDGLRVRGQNAGFQRSNRQPLLGILEFWAAWTIFAPQMQRN